MEENKEIKITCEANGFPAPVITWFKNGPIKRRVYVGKTLTLKKIKFKDRGTYICVAENLLGSVQSFVNVTVQGNLSIW